jgi:predicted molibdopterin-dependent oxidoreductase YjgC
MKSEKREMIRLTIDGRECESVDGQTVFQVARANEVRIPTLCYHPALKPSGACKLCAVEVTEPGKHERVMLSCLLKAKDGMLIRTQSEAVKEARTVAFQKLLQMAPYAEIIRALAKEYDVPVEAPPDGCVRCRLCIHVCQEIVGPGALKMEKRDGINYMVPAGGCIGCGTCANLCPTHAIRTEDVENVRIISIRDEVIGRHPLERCEGCGKLFATPSFLKHIENRTVARHPDVKTHHKYCSTCAKLFSDRVRSFVSRM